MKERKGKYFFQQLWILKIICLSWTKEKQEILTAETLSNLGMLVCIFNIDLLY